MVAKIDSLSGISDDVLGTGVSRVSPSDEFLHLVDVERSNDLGESHVLRDRPRNADLKRKTF